VFGNKILLMIGKRHVFAGRVTDQLYNSINYLDKFSSKKGFYRSNTHYELKSGIIQLRLSLTFNEYVKFDDHG